MIDYEDIEKVSVCDPNGIVLYETTKHFYIMLADKEINGDNDTDKLVIKHNQVPLFPVGSKAHLIFTLSDNETADAEGENVLSAKGRLIVAGLRRKPKETDRRRFYKIVTNEKCLIFGLTKDNDIEVIEPPLTGVVNDINLGGIFVEVVSGLHFYKNDIISAELTLNGEKLELLLEVLRVVPKDDGITVGYGCRFMYIEPNVEAAIAKYVNAQQVQRRQTERAQEEYERQKMEDAVAKAKAKAEEETKLEASLTKKLNQIQKK